MKKWLSIILCVIFLMALVGCVNEPGGTSTPVNMENPSTGSQPNSSQNTNSQPTDTQTPERDYRMPTVDEDYWELLCENCDITMYFDNTRENFLMFMLLATQDPAGKTMTITTDTGYTSEVMVYQDGDPKVMEFGLFLMYQDFDWESLKTDIKTQGEMLKPWEAKYAEATSKIPRLYHYHFYIPLDFLGIDVTSDQSQQLKSLTVTLDGQTKTYDLGKVIFLPGRAPVNNGPEGGLRSSIPMISGRSTYVSEAGILEVPQFNMTAKKDVVLQGISFPGSEGVTVASCELVITTPFGDKFNMTWDGSSPIEVDEGSKIQVKLTLADPALADTMIANALRYISLDYTRDGEAYGELVYMSCLVNADPHAYYAWKVDGMDMRPYYYEYKYMMHRDNSENP